MIFDVRDKDITKQIRRFAEFAPITSFSDSILVEKNEIDDLEQQKQSLMQDNMAVTDTSNAVDNKMGTNQQETIILKLQEDLEQ
jgi:hypothetical protein